MDQFTRNDLETLVQARTPPCVSVYLPTVRAGEQAQQNPIHLKNLLAEAEEILITQGQRAVAARELIQPVHKLLTSPVFWNEQCDGLAVFLSPNELLSWRLPLRFDPFVWVGNRFYVKPLFALRGDDRYYLLAVSQNKVRLWFGTRWELSEMPGDTLPKSLADALRYDQPEGMIQSHSANPALRGKEGAVFHGQGGAVDDAKDDLLAYFRAIDGSLHDLLRDEGNPLIFAGVDYLFPIYQKANTYPHLWPQCLSGNPDLLSKCDLECKARELLGPRWREPEIRAAESFPVRERANRASGNVADILRAAYEGRVETLFIARQAHCWGRYEADTGNVEQWSEPKAGSDDLLELAALSTFNRRGQVYVVEDREVPGGTPAAALYRYAK